MKNVFNLFSVLTILLLVTFTSCSTNNNKGDVIELSLTDANIVSKFAEWTEKGVRIERIYKNVNDKDGFIYAEGVDLKGNFVIARYSELTGITESCRGVGCSLCYFPISGGCDCERKETENGYCDHTVIKNKE